MPNERKHTNVKIARTDNEESCRYLTPQPVYLGRDSQGRDRWTIVVYFERPLWGKFEMATYHKTDLTLSRAEMLADSALAAGLVDLYYWRPHY